MIVTCPSCERDYQLKQSQIAWAPIPKVGGQGVKLVCSHCNHEWWERKPEASIHRNRNEFINKTDLSLLRISVGSSGAVPHARQPIAPLVDKPFLSSVSPMGQDMPKSSTQQPLERTGPVFQATDNADLHTLNSTLDRLEKESFHPEKARFPYGWFLFFLTLVVLAGAVGFLFFKEDLFQKENPATGGIESKELVVKNVHYDVRMIEGEKVVTVLGEVGNPDVKDVDVPKLDIILLGPCPANNEMSQPVTPQPNGLCAMYAWPYRWTQPSLRAGETVPFQTSATVPAGLDIQQVDVDIK